MNLPNKLTVLRVILIPLFMFFFLNCGVTGLYLSLVVFILATLTDYFDGQIARRTKCVTTFGKLMDPIADKLLVIGALISFLASDVIYINAWVLLIIIAREFIVTGVRLLAVGEGVVISASPWGKLKTVSQFILIIVVIINQITMMHRNPLEGGFGNFLVMALVIITVIFTLVSGIDYIYKNRDLITFK